MSHAELVSYFPSCDNVAYLFCSRHGSYMSHLDDAKQEARIACWRMSQAYDPGRGAFWTFARRRIRGAVIDYLRSMNVIIRPGEACVLFIPLDDVSVNHPAAPAVNYIARLDAQTILGILPLHEREIMQRHYLQEETSPSIGEALGIGERKVTRSVERANRMVKKWLLPQRNTQR